MSSPADGNTSVDFFASIVALASITLFTKFVTHRTRSGDLTSSPGLHIWHVTCIGASCFAAGLALFALEMDADPPPYLHITTAALVATAGVILAVDGLVDDSKRVKSRGRWGKEIKAAFGWKGPPRPPGL